MTILIEEDIADLADRIVGWAKAPALTKRRSTAAEANFFMSASWFWMML
jgi:hypothetical protein